MINYRSAVRRSHNTVIGNGEGTPFELMQINLSKPGLVGERRYLSGHVQDVFFVCAFDHKDDKAITRVNSDSDVVILLQNDCFRRLVQTSVEIGMGLQSWNDRLDQKWKIRESDSLLFCH